MGTSAQVQTGAYAYLDATKIGYLPYNTIPAPVLSSQGVSGGQGWSIGGPITSTAALGFTPATIWWVADFGNLMRRIPQAGDISGPSYIRPPGQPLVKGIRPTNVFVVYSVDSGTITFPNNPATYPSTAITLTQLAFRDSAPPVITSLQLDPTVVLPGAPDPVYGGYTHVITIPIINPVFLGGDEGNLTLEFAWTMATAAGATLFGMGMHYDYNFT